MRALQPLPRVDPEGADGPAALADYDALLGLPLDEQSDPNVHGPFGFAKLLDFGGKGVGELVAEQLEGSLTEVFHHEEPERLGPDVVGIVGELPFGELLAHARQQVGQAHRPRRR